MLQVKIGGLLLFFGENLCIIRASPILARILR
jgi:hypothetical protein